MAKRGLNIYKRKDGRWEGRYKSGYTVAGKTKYCSVYGKSYTAVKELLEQRRALVRSNKCCCQYTVGELCEMWLSDIRNRVKDSTISNYVMKLNKHILPCFSGVKYEKLTANDINAFISKKQTESLSAKYISDIVVLIKSIAKFALRQYGFTNRIECLTLPQKPKNTERKLLTTFEQGRLKAALEKNLTSSNIGVLLASATGMRVGELCALKWENIDLEKSIITVKSTVQRISDVNGGTRLIVSSPKSSSSVREIPLPDFVIPYLKCIQADDNCYLISGSKKLVEPRVMQYRFQSLLKKENLPSVNFHALRHMFATNCVLLGFDIKTLSEILGHGSPQITLNCYVHSSMERKKQCMKLFSKSLSA